MKKPIIGILPLFDSEKDSIWMLPGYQKGLEKAGAQVLIFPYTNDLDEILTVSALCDGYLFTGGQDVDPNLYNEKKQPFCGEISPVLDTLTKIVFEDAKFSDKAVLGICRGCQILNVLFGGTLYQDLNTQYSSENGAHIEHHQNKPYDSTSHKVTLNQDSYLHKLLKKDVLDVNSIHHQGIKDLGMGLSVNAVSEDGIVEAIKANDYNFMLGVQWHPEYNFFRNEDSMSILKAFVKETSEEFCI